MITRLRNGQPQADEPKGTARNISRIGLVSSRFILGTDRGKGDPMAAKILWHGTVVRDGFHNMGPHIIRWRNMYLIGIRKAEWHFGSAAGAIHILASADRRRWRDVATLKLNGDNRDSEFVIAPDGRLAVTWVTIPSAADSAQPWGTQPYVAFTDDGHNWTEPQPILGHSHHFFSVKPFEGRYYGLNCRRWPNPDGSRKRALELCVSDDLLSWETVSQIGPDATGMNEAAIWFDADKRAHVIARTERKPEGLAVYATAAARYTDWQLHDLPTVLHCPRVIDSKNGPLLAARHFPAKEGDVTWPFGASLGLWRVHLDADAGCRLEPLLRLPATGDSSYSSMIRDVTGNLLLTYYSQHAYHWGVLPPFAGKVTTETMNFGDHDLTPCANDIYLAELEVE